MKNNTINKKEIEKFSKIAEEWWNPDGKFKPLHKFNPIRIAYIKDNIVKKFKTKNIKKPLEKVKILDIGCGGGLLSEPMKRLGADIVGIDASNKNIEIAKLHAKKNKLDIRYYCTPPEKFKTDIKFDVILNMEIVLLSMKIVFGVMVQSQKNIQELEMRGYLIPMQIICAVLQMMMKFLKRL